MAHQRDRQISYTDRQTDKTDLNSLKRLLKATKYGRAFNIPYCIIAMKQGLFVYSGQTVESAMILGQKGGRTDLVHESDLNKRTGQHSDR